MSYFAEVAKMQMGKVMQSNSQRFLGTFPHIRLPSIDLFDNKKPPLGRRHKRNLFKTTQHKAMKNPPGSPPRQVGYARICKALKPNVQARTKKSHIPFLHNHQVAEAEDRWARSQRVAHVIQLECSHVGVGSPSACSSRTLG